MSHHEIDLTPLRRYLDELTPRSSTMLLPALHHAQSLYGWLPEAAQRAISTALRVPLADVHGVIEFYTMFYNEPTARRVIRVCEDPACHLGGADSVLRKLSERLSVGVNETSADGSVTLEAVPCLGMCEHAPCGLLGELPAGELGVGKVGAFLAGEVDVPAPKVYGEPFLTLHRVGKVDPTSLQDYEAHGGYAELRRALAMTPDAIIELFKQSDIKGRGGAMFPLGAKWDFTRQAPGLPAGKHVVANADESEPGTFKDRNLMEGDPFSLVEALTIAGYGVGAENGWIFVRGEYPRCYERLTHAVAEARKHGYLGRDILGKTGFNFDIQVRLGAGAYICGEETALFEAIEGRRGFPRIKPPFPTTHGLFGQPTAINNVETLVTGMAVLRVGTDHWRGYGTEDSPGTKWFCLSGHVARPGVYELPFGATVRELVARAGGVPAGRDIQAVLMGGAAGVFIGPEQLDLRLTYEDTRAAGVPLGSGVIMVFDDTVDLRAILYQLSRFFAHESCGKCFPCQLGTQRQMEILARVARDGAAHPSDRATLLDVGFTMTTSSLCGLGQTAASAISSALIRWPELAE